MSKLKGLKSFDKKTLIYFLVVAVGSQLIYALNSVKSVLYGPYRDALGVTNAQLGFLFSLVGIVSTIAYVPGGWLMDRFSARKLMSINLFLSAISGFYLATAPSYTGLLFIFALWGLIQEAFYWPSVLKSVRLIATEKTQGTAFGSLELVRGITSMAVGALAIFIYGVFGQQLLGIKVALAVNSVLILLMGILTWVVLPEEDYLQGDTAGEKNTMALKGLLRVLKMKEVWLVGIEAMGIYAMYIAMTYFLPFLQDVYAIPVMYVAVFGMFNTHGTRMIASPLSGVIGDKLFSSSTKLMRMLLFVIIAFLGFIIAVPKTSTFMIAGLALLILITVMIYMLRGVYYAPIGELKMDKEISGSAMSVAAFIGYSPMFWAYGVYGKIIDSYEPGVAYTRVFMIMAVFGVVGFITSMILCKLIDKRKNEQVGNSTSNASA